YALEEQVRRYQVAGRVQKYEAWEMLSLVLDEHQVCRGLVAMNLRSLELKAFPADAVIIATGGPGLIFGKSTNSMVCTGSAVSACYQQGARYANGEFIQVHPTSIPGEDKLRLMSESARGEGGRVWVPKAKGDKRQPSSIPESERWYFLEEKYPAYGNLVPRDIATREIFQVCLDGFGVFGENQVYLDLTHIPAETLDRKLGAILEIYEMFVGDGSRVYDDELKRQQEINERLLKQPGTENQYVIHEEMGKWMTDNVTVVRYNDKLKATDEKLLELFDRYQHISLNDSNMWATHALPHARQLQHMLQLARVITLGALNRNESRGAHYNPDCPDRDGE